MAMVYDIVQQFHGKLNVESEPGRGTTIELFLPIASPEQGAASSSSRGTVLIIDDEDIVRSVASLMLGQSRYRTREAVDARSGLRAYQSERPDVVLLDVTLPDSSGDTLAAEILNHDPTARIILFSGSPFESAPAEGIAATLTKPFQQAELVATVNKVLGKPSA